MIYSCWVLDDNVKADWRITGVHLYHGGCHPCQFRLIRFCCCQSWFEMCQMSWWEPGGSLHLVLLAERLIFFCFFVVHHVHELSVLCSFRSWLVSPADQFGKLKAAAALPRLRFLELQCKCSASTVILLRSNKSFPDRECDHDWLDFLSDFGSLISIAVSDH